MSRVFSVSGLKSAGVGSIQQWISSIEEVALMDGWIEGWMTFLQPYSSDFWLSLHLIGQF